MARATLTVTTLGPDNVLTDITTSSATTVTTGGGNGVQFPNTLGSFLVLISTGTTTTLTVNIGTTVLGQAVTSFSVVVPGTAGTYQVGPFHSAVNVAGNVAIDFTSATGITVGAFQLAGVY